MKTINGIRVPELGDFANVPADLERIAEDVHKSVVDAAAAVRGVTGDTVASVAASLAGLAARVTTLETNFGNRKVYFGSGNVTCDSNGNGRIYWRADQQTIGWAPTVCVLTCAVTGERGLSATIDSDSSMSSASAPINVWNVDTGAPWVGNVRVHFIIRA